MELVLLLLPIAVMLTLGWTHFPAMTFLFVVYVAGFGLREGVRARVNLRG